MTDAEKVDSYAKLSANDPKGTYFEKPSPLLPYIFEAIE